MTKTREPQYEELFDGKETKLGPMTGWTWRQNPSHLVRTLAHYDFVAKHMAGFHRVAEIGCADAFASDCVAQTVDHLDLYDFDTAWGVWVKKHDIVHDGPL